jgi:hypothetical protein
MWSLPRSRAIHLVLDHNKLNNLSANQTVNFSASNTADSSPDPQPATYPNYLASSPSAPSGSCNITGTWADQVSGGTWYITQTGSTLSGSLSFTPPAQYGCGPITWQVTGQISGSAANLTASNPNPAVQACSPPNKFTASNPVTANVTFSSCSAGAANETAQYPAGGAGFASGGGPTTVSGSGPWNLASSPLTFTISSPSQMAIPGTSNNSQMVAFSIGDTNVQMQTTSSIGSYPVNVTYSVLSEGNPNSNCGASLSIPDGSGTGSATSSVSASSLGCSGIFGAYGNVSGTTTRNAIDVVVPRDILVRELWGEANAQPTKMGDQVSELAIGNAIRQRFGDGLYFSHFHNYQDMNIGVGNQGFDGLDRCPPGCLSQVQHATETLNAAYIFGGVNNAATNVDDAKCFMSPTPPDWQKISAALQSQTTVFPTSLQQDAGCWDPAHRQVVYKSSIGNNAGYSSPVPAFVFEQWRYRLRQRSFKSNETYFSKKSC